MTRPTQVFVWMFPFLALVGVAVFLLYGPLANAFLSNPVFNSIIVGVFLIGILINLRQVGMLSSEVAWVNKFRGQQKWFSRRAPEEPKMLSPLAKMLGKRDHEFLSLSPLSLRSLLDSVRLRLDESRDISRYMIGLLIFLGLLGTFWGLLITVDSVGQMIGNLGNSAGDGGAMFGSLMKGLHGPLSGMGTAFSSSLFGLAGSLILGFLDLQAGHAQNRFFYELEDWLSGVTRLGVGAPVGDQEPSTPAYIHAMLEQTAETLDRLQRNVSRDEAQRRLIGEQIQMLGKEMAAFSDLSRDEQRLASRVVESRGSFDESLQEHVRSLDTSLKQLLDEVATGRERLVDEIRDELRLMGRALTSVSDSSQREQEQASKERH